VEQTATLITLEMGKILASAPAEVTKCARVLPHYAEHIASCLRTVEAGAVGARSASVVREPIGVVLAVMPWNSSRLLSNWVAATRS
jgi:acyl-CoA reductase-like NAD-dependent aldehyde dehydrogenase